MALMGLFGGGNAAAAAAAEAAAAGAGRGGVLGGLLGGVVEAVQTLAAKPATNADWCVAGSACAMAGRGLFVCIYMTNSFGPPGPTDT